MARMVSCHVAEPSKEAAASAQGLYGSFDAFLKQAIREYYDRGWTTRKGNFIALLIAVGLDVDGARERLGRRRLGHQEGRDRRRPARSRSASASATRSAARSASCSASRRAHR